MQAIQGMTGDIQNTMRHDRVSRQQISVTPISVKAKYREAAAGR